MSLRSEKTHAEQKALGAHEGPRCAGGRLPSGVSLDPLYPYFKTRLTWIKEQGGNCNKVHLNYAKSGKQPPWGTGEEVKGGPDPIFTNPL